MLRKLVGLVLILAVVLSGTPVLAESSTMTLGEEIIQLSPSVYMQAYGMLAFNLRDWAWRVTPLDVILFRVMNDGSLKEEWSKTTTSGEELILPSAGNYRLGVYTQIFVQWEHSKVNEYKDVLTATVCPIRLTVNPRVVMVGENTSITFEWAPSIRAVIGHCELYIDSTQWSRQVNWTLNYRPIDLTVCSFQWPRQGYVTVRWTEYGDGGEIVSSGMISKTLEVLALPTATPMVTDTLMPTPTATPTSTATPTEMPTNTLMPTETPTSTSTPTSTATNTPTNTSTPTEMPTKTNTPTKTPTETPTPTVMPTKTNTPTLTNTSTALPTVTSTPTSTVTSFRCLLPLVVR